MIVCSLLMAALPGCHPEAQTTKAAIECPPSSHLTAPAVEGARRSFQSLDRNGDGFVSRDEWVQAATDAARKTHASSAAQQQYINDLSQDFDNMDVNRTGKIDLQQFLVRAERDYQNFSISWCLGRQGKTG